MGEISKSTLFKGRVLYGIFHILGCLPSWWHYFWSLLFSYILQYVVGYRRLVVRRNLQNSFPEKSPAELKAIERKFYRHLCDLGVEVIMLAAFSEKRFRKHVIVENPELMTDLHRESRSIFFLLGHYGNWEWYTGCQLLLPMTEFNVTYQKQKGVWDYLMWRLRSKFGSRLLEKTSAAHDILSHRHDDVNRTYIMVADQSPSLVGTELFVTFLNQPTAVITGMERIAMMLRSSAVYIDVTHPKRGVYRLKLVEMTKDVRQLPRHRLSKNFMMLLEDNIRRQPELWLWSHKRWKYTPQMVAEQYPNKIVEMP